MARAISGFLLLFLSLSGPALVDAQTPASTTTADATELAKVAAAAPKVSPNYVIGPGDTLQVFVWRNPELTATVPVRPDGKISTPLVEDMIAVGKTPSVLARDLEAVLGTYVRAPQVNVIVLQPVSTLSQIRVVGQVTKPQAVAFRDGMTVLDVILQVGGLSPFAAGNRARIVRTEGGKETQIPLRLEALLNKGDMRQNLPLKPNDVIVVPESMF